MIRVNCGVLGSMLGSPGYGNSHIDPSPTVDVEDLAPSYTAQMKAIALHWAY